MRIVLIQPKMKMRPMDTGLKIRMSPSLALLTLQRLTPQRHNVIIVNENIEDIDFSIKADLVAITVTVDVFPGAVRISSRFRTRGVKVVAGGIHITATPDMAQEHFDAVCVGMAEAYWQQLLDDAENNALKKIYKQNPEIDGSMIASPDYNIIDRNKYLYCNIISTSRGCPHKCDFCYNSCANATKHIVRPIDSVIEDILSLKTKHIMFIDDNFIGDINWTYDFLKRIKPLGLKWNAAVTSNIVNHPDLLDLMKETGCQSLFIGFETINNKSLESVHKRQNDTAKYSKLVSEIHSRQIMINASFVFGLPGDIGDIFDSTLQWVIENKIETVTAHILTPYPGTFLYKTMLENKRITDFDLSNYNTANVVFLPERMSPEELSEGYITFYKRLYSSRNILKRLPESKKQWAPYLLFNFFYRKFGKFTEVLSNIIPLNVLGKLATKLAYHVK